MAVISRIKRLFKSPILFGLTAGVIVALLNILVAAIAEGSFHEGLSMFLSFGIFAYLVPIAVAIQMGLFMYHRNVLVVTTLHRPDKVGISGSALSSMTMVACCICCAYQVSGILPTIGFLLSASSFLTQYRDVIITAGLAINAIGSILILRAIILNKKKKSGLTVYTI